MISCCASMAAPRGGALCRGPQPCVYAGSPRFPHARGVGLWMELARGCEPAPHHPCTRFRSGPCEACFFRNDGMLVGLPQQLEASGSRSPSTGRQPALPGLPTAPLTSALCQVGESGHERRALRHALRMRGPLEHSCHRGEPPSPGDALLSDSVRSQQPDEVRLCGAPAPAGSAGSADASCTNGNEDHRATCCAHGCHRCLVAGQQSQLHDATLRGSHTPSFFVRLSCTMQQNGTSLSSSPFFSSSILDGYLARHHPPPHNSRPTTIYHRPASEASFASAACCGAGSAPSSGAMCSP